METVTTGMEAAFTRAYTQKKWHNGSGSGSEPRNTLTWRCFLAGFMDEMNTAAILDIGCGDLKMFRNFSHLKQTSYTGIEVVPSVAAAASTWPPPGGQILCGDALEIPWPAADLVIIKDVVQHWPESAIHRLWDHLAQAAPAHCLIVTDIPGAVGEPLDIEPGGYRAPRLRHDPFNWPVAEFMRYQAPRPGKIYTKTVLGW